MRRPEQSKEPAFQLAWCLLHLTGAAMNLGSFIYHLKRIRREESEDSS